jgi:uncharacterized membrane protein
VGVVLLIVAGILFIVGAFVPAATAEIQGRSTSTSLWDQDWEGWASLIVGIVLLLGAAWLMMSRRDVRAVGVAVAVLRIAGAAVAIYKILNIESEAVNRAAPLVAARTGIPLEAAKQALEQLFAAGAASVTVSIGLWLVVIAGVVALVAGIMLAMARSAQPMVTGEPTQTQAPME